MSTSAGWRHGTLTGYERCNGGGRKACPRCREARRVAGEQLRKRKAYGQTSPRDLLDSTKAMQALHIMTSAGHNTMAIGRLSGMANQQIGRLLHGHQHLITRENHERILSALQYVLQHPTWHKPDARVDSTRAWQQMRSLSALGWPMDWLCREIGYTRFKPLPTMRRSTAARIQDLYDRLSGTRGPSSRAAAHAKHLGWHVPLAYDEDGQLVPGAVPDALTDARERRARRAERPELVARLTAQGQTAEQIAQALDITPRTVVRDRARKAIAS